MMITVQRGTPAEEKERRRELRERITALNMKFMLTDEDIDAIEILQKEYYGLLVLADSEGALAANEKKHLKIFSKTLGPTQAFTAP